MAEPTRFVLLAAPRTGSNWLCTMLDSHPAILCHHEIFNPDFIRLSQSCSNGEIDLGTVAERDRAPLAVLQRVWANPLGRSVVGFKINRGQDERVFTAVLGDRSVRTIVLRRRNRVKSYVSEAVAMATGEWESYPYSPASAGQRRIDAHADALHAHIAANAAYYDGLYARLRERGDSPLELTYERLHDIDEQRRILAFLGVAPVGGELQALTRKQNSRDLRDIIRNFDQFAEQLAGTEFADELQSTDD